MPQAGCFPRKRSSNSPPIQRDPLDNIFRYRQRSFSYQLGRFCQRSTFHGLADVQRAQNKCLRAFWLLIFFGAFVASGYGCYAILNQYLEAPVVASYFIQEAPARFPLPDLIVCPFNRFNADFLKRYNISNDVAQYMQLTFGSSAKHPAQRRELAKAINATLLAELDVLTNSTLQRLNMTFGQFLDAASLKCTDLFIDCVRPTGKFSCCENATDVMTFAGKCYRVGGVDQLGPGYGYGMSVVVSLPKTLYSLALNNWLNDGVVLKLAERAQGVDYDLTFVPVGTHALMPLKATKYEFMNDPPRFECLEHAVPNYSRVDCFDSCFTEAAQQACQCVIVTNMKRHNLPACTTYQYYFCILAKLRQQFSKEKDTEGYFYRCRQRCTPRCTYHQYTSLISYSKFPSDQAKAFTFNESEWSRMKNTIIIDIYYEKLEYTLIKHYRAMTVHGFIANIGGQYSLWLGGSVLTLVQVLVFLMNFVFSKCFYSQTDTSGMDDGPVSGHINLEDAQGQTGLDTGKTEEWTANDRRPSRENGYYDQDYRFISASYNNRRSNSYYDHSGRNGDLKRSNKVEHDHSSSPQSTGTMANGLYVYNDPQFPEKRSRSFRASFFRRHVPKSPQLRHENIVDIYKQDSEF